MRGTGVGDVRAVAGLEKTLAMKKYLRFDSVGGASGDMILSALVSVGADLPAIEKALNSFFPEPLRLQCETASASGLTGVCLKVHCPASGVLDPASCVLSPESRVVSLGP